MHKQPAFLPTWYHGPGNFINCLLFNFVRALFFYTFAAQITTVVVAQLVRAPDCDSGGRGFEPPHPPHKSLLFIQQEAFFYPNTATYPFYLPQGLFNKTLLR